MPPFRWHYLKSSKEKIYTRMFDYTMYPMAQCLSEIDKKAFTSYYLLFHPPEKENKNFMDQRREDPSLKPSFWRLVNVPYMCHHQIFIEKYILFTPFFFILLFSHERRLLSAHPESWSLNPVGPSRPPNLRLHLRLHPCIIPVSLQMLSCSLELPSQNWRRTSTDVTGWHDDHCPALTL